MKKKIIYIRLFSIIGIICILGFVVGIVVGLFKGIDSRDRREGYTNNGLEVHNNLGFGGGGGRGSGGGGYDDGVAEKWGYGWGDDVVKHFLTLQSTINPEYIFNVNKMQKYINKDEVDVFLANDGKWNWTDETKQMYLNYINRDPRSKEWVDPSFDMQKLQTVYSESAIQKLLGEEGCGGVKRNKIGVFVADEDDAGVLHEGRENDGSGIRTFGVNSGLLSNGNCCYDLLM